MSYEYKLRYRVAFERSYREFSSLTQAYRFIGPYLSREGCWACRITIIDNKEGSKCFDAEWEYNKQSYLVHQNDHPELMR